jgi:choline monooxygenase
MFKHRTALEHLLPPNAYTGAEFFAEEQARLFTSSWHYLCRADALPHAGDRFAATVLGVPVVVRRVGSGLVAHRNVCAHRHSVIVPPGFGRGAENSSTLRCLYHGWEYDEGGRLSRLPDGASFNGFKARGVCLESFPVEVVGGSVFVTLSADAGSFRASLGEFAEEFDRFYGAHRVAMVWSTEHDVNWKVIAENAVESYHVPAIHPGTFAEYRDEALHDHELSTGFTRYRDLKPWDSTLQSLAGRLFTSLIVKSPTHARFTQAHVFPNYLLYYGDLFSSVIVLEPLGPQRTRHVQMMLVPRALKVPLLSRLLQSVFTRIAIPFGKRIMREDMQAWPLMQAGLRASRGRGVLSAREERVFWFQRFVAEQVGRTFTTGC